MSLGKARFLLYFSGLLLLFGCSQTPLPTPLPLAALPTPLPATATSLPPTLDLTSSANQPAPTSQAPATPAGAVANVPPTPTAAPAAAAAGINITVPDENAEILMGSDILVRGLVQKEPLQSVWLSLVTFNGHLLAEAQAVVDDVSWQAGLTVPESVGGTAVLQASVRDAAGQIVSHSVTAIRLILNADNNDRYLALYRPVPGDAAMGGFNLFFDGRAQAPVNNTVTISVWVDGCQTQAARQSFVLRGSGYWQGFVILPNTISGPGCAIAHFGTPGEDSWREVVIPIEIAANDDSEASGVVIGNPPAESSVTAGQELLLYGTALNASESTVQITVLLENGRIVSQNSVATDYWGYWELPIILPVDVEGRASISASAGDSGAGNFAETQTLITIKPAPDPSP